MNKKAADTVPQEQSPAATPPWRWAAISSRRSNMLEISIYVVPAQAGIPWRTSSSHWVPACAGTTASTCLIAGSIEGQIAHLLYGTTGSHLETGRSPLLSGLTRIAFRHGYLRSSLYPQHAGIGQTVSPTAIVIMLPLSPCGALSYIQG